MNHKIVCWSDYAIPVPVEANWMAMDNDGEWNWYEAKPKAEKDRDFWFNPEELSYGIIGNCAAPPEPGPWTEQLYWIGD